MPIMSSGAVTPGTGKVTFPDSSYASGASTSSTGSGSSTSSTSSGSGSGTFTVSGQNLGTPPGVGIFSNVVQNSSSSATLTFLSLVAGAGITLTATSESITIASTGSGGTISGIVPVSEGGTGLSAIASNDILLGSGSDVLNLLAAPTSSNQFLYFDGNQIAWSPFVIQASNIQGLSAVATSGSYTDLANIPEPYVLPPATNSALGGVAIGNGLSIDSNGILSANVISVNNQTGVVTLTAADVGAVASDMVGVSNGVASLDVNGKVPYSELPASLLGSLAYQGTWNANTNQPDILTGSASAENNGWFYVVDTAGLTVVDGNTNWQVGYWIISNGTVWNQIQSANDVTSVNGQTGAVEINAATLDLATVATSGSYTDLINLPDTTLPLATTTTLGAVIVGNGLNIASNGVLSIGNEFGEGNVQSVALQLPSIFAVNGSPVTSTGTLNGVLLSQEANTFFAGPISGSADIPTFRAISSSDLPIAGDTIGAVSVGAGLSITDNGNLSADMLSFNGRVGDITFLASDMQVPHVPGIENPLVGTFILTSPEFTGTPTAPTPAVGDNSTQIATTAFVTNFVDNYSLPIATTSSLGGVIPSTGLTITDNGTLTANMQSFEGRTGAVTLQASDLQVPYVEGIINPLVGTFLLGSPALSGIPTTPTPAVGDNSTQIANTEFVTNLVTTYVDNYNLLVATVSSLGGIIVGDGLTVTGNGTTSANVVSVAGRTGVITLSVSDIAGGAPISSPSFNGTPTVPTATTGNSSTQIANTEFVTTFVENYVDNYNLPAASTTSLGGVIISSGLTITDNGTLSANVQSFNNRTGTITLLASDLQVPYVPGIENPLVGTFLLASPEFTGTPTTPTAAAGDSSTQIANTEFVTNTVTSYVNNYNLLVATASSLGGVSVGAGLSITDSGVLSAAVVSVNGLTGALTLTATDVGAAPIASPEFTGNPTAPTPSAGDSSSSIATTEFVQYAISGASEMLYNLENGWNQSVPASGYAAPIINLIGGLGADATVVLPTTGKWTIFNNTSGNYTMTATCNTGPSLVIPQGGSIDIVAYNGIYLSNEIGVTRPFDDSTTFLATTEFVATALGGLSSGVTTFNGRAGAVAFEASDITGVGGALLASPAFSGIPTVPTATFGTNTQQIASTAFVTGNFAPLASPIFTGTPTAPTPLGGDNSQNIATTAFVTSGFATISSPAFKGTPTSPTPSVGDDSTNIATTAFVQQFLSSTITVSLTSTAGDNPQPTTMTLTPAQYGAEIIVFDGAPSVSIEITMPSSGQWMVYNNATGTNSVSLTNGEGAVYELPQFQSAVVLSLGELGIINANVAGNFITPATASTIGGVIIPNGGGLSVDQDGNLTVGAASSSTVGGVSQGAGVTISNTGVLSANVTSVAGRTGNVVLTIADVSGAAPLASPALSGVPTAPTAAAGTKTTQIATTAFVANSFAPLASPAFTGTPTAPTPAVGDNSTDIATTAFVATSYAPLASPVFSGSPTAPTPSSNDDSQRIATTSWVTTAIQNADSASGYAPINAPSFTGRATFVAQEYDVTNLGNISGTETLNLAASTEWTMTITGATTFAFSNTPAAGTTQVVILRITNGGAYTISWPTGTQFVSGAAPALTSSGVDILGVKYDTVTSTYMVFVIGLNMFV